jgi:DNA repair protein RadA/Sms
LAKAKVVFICSSCDFHSPKWEGKCPQCETWNSLEETQIFKENKQQSARSAIIQNDDRFIPNKAILINDVQAGKTSRVPVVDPELARVLGGGVVPGSVILVGGQPGIGKSTLLLQLALQNNFKVFYVSGEESEEQIKLRANRITQRNDDCYLFTNVSTDKILSEAKRIQPAVMIIDSIQTLTSPLVDSIPGTISQIRECAYELQRFAKESGITVFIIGHITKDGNIAGPKILEHIVDTVLQFEGDQNHMFRVLRTTKNRFGSTDEIGIYEMITSGLRPVTNPSELFLRQGDSVLSGSAIAATVEGLRPLLIEVQALVSTAIYGTPQRSATGYDLRRMSMLLAVLEKRCGFAFGHNDVFLNLAGGIKINDPSIDLSIVAALISSLEDTTIEDGICFCGEVGLSGEIRSVNRLEQRIQEADRMGFKEMYISKFNTKGINFEKYKINITPIGKVEELYELLFANV